MAWVYVEQVIESGVVVDPRDVDVSLARFAGEMNGHLDRDNLDGTAITPAKLANRALVAVGSNPQYDNDTIIQTIPADQTGQWIAITSLETTATCEEGELIVDADVNMLWGTAAAITNGSNDKFELQLVVDGIPIAHSGWTHERRPFTTVSLTNSIPVTRGSHVIQVLIRAWSDPWLQVGDIANGENLTTTKGENLGYTTAVIWFQAGNVVWVNRRR